MKNNFIIVFISLVFCDPFDGYTLITQLGGGTHGGGNQNRQTHLIDNNQNIINSWIHDTGPASIAYLTPDSLLYVPCKVSNQGGGQGQGGGGPGGGRFKIMNWDGNIIWDYYLPEDICSPHHDIAVLSNGNILAICSETRSQEEASNMGFIDIDGPMTLDMIIEIEPVGSNDANIVWKWHFWDRLIQDVNPFANNYAVISENPHLLNINCQFNSGSGSGADSGITDWNHCNCISYNENYKQIVISSRHMSEFYIIDHSTTIEEAASHSGGIYGRGGDFLYRWGNPQNYNRGSSQILDAQHGVNWIPQGYPGAGNFILFNNLHGVSGSSSAILEIESIMDENGYYSINETDAYGPNSFYWIYQPPGLFSNFQSGAFRLPNGNTLITSTSQQDVFEINQFGDIEWQYVGDLNAARAIKYPLDYFNSLMLGDINEDLQINILDVVLLVNVVLGIAESNSYCDLNEDESVDVLDVVQLVNLIIN